MSSFAVGIVMIKNRRKQKSTFLVKNKYDPIDHSFNLHMATIAWTCLLNWDFKKCNIKSHIPYVPYRFYSNISDFNKEILNICKCKHYSNVTSLSKWLLMCFLPMYSCELYKSKHILSINTVISVQNFYLILKLGFIIGAGSDF